MRRSHSSSVGSVFIPSAISSLPSGLYLDHAVLRCLPFAWPPLSDRNPLDDVAGDGFVPTVVEVGGAGVGVAGEALDVFERHALGEQVGDDGDAEGVRRELGGQGSVAEAALHHAGDVVGGEGTGGGEAGGEGLLQVAAAQLGGRAGPRGFRR